MAASFKQIVATLRREEQRLMKQVARLRNAISSLEFGGGGAVVHPFRRIGPVKRKRRKMSAEAREKIRQAQLRRWAKQKGSARK